MDEALRAHARDLALGSPGSGIGLAFLGGLAVLGLVGGQKRRP